MSDDTETRRTKDSQARTPEQQKVLDRVRRYMGDADLSEDLYGWAVIETSGGRFFGKVVREYTVPHAVDDFYAKDGRWLELAAVDLQPYFSLPWPEVITLRYDVEHHSRSILTGEKETKREQRVGAGIGEGAFLPGNMKTFHRLEQVKVTAISRAWRGEEPNWSDIYRMLMFGTIIERVGIMMDDEDAQRQGRGQTDAGH
jgi:hypothetical protein